uniref:DNA/RNA-binding protein Alba-like domain-containing protein n=1 Tax=Odontella aurita TaxID=265563 RepID=A0A7S4IZZ8_9STRA|mmetsp:Transcript_34473/g.103096  ORF Transcript_34473/g.103096 Transcript_34473/m.103096 type:complete len:175 (+) Transcript_34473:176-700(+)|eukprot:CAMPEP_0113526622 /NCGR_PEP_ID=MMETSP0015_2-20120614/848_1 /TAXON_ID=2838 /ORGANISM="Odontella" /LENGTH=174 /DNA_ID=CAMNT_0000424977 /DNA_START=176 /DNA_END=700 /DNA_ORIENTATION=+ /assembly_acc=CAM_ASM_000160
MEKYRLIGERKSEVTEGGDNDSASEVRITQQGKPRNYISYALGLFDQGCTQIELKAMGRAINKAVTIAEILKRKMPLHQITSLSSSEIVDVFEPLEEGLDIVESKRYVSCMVITLSKDGSGMDVNDIGYQPPLPSEEIQPGDLNVARGSQASSGRGGGPPPAAAAAASHSMVSA